MTVQMWQKVAVWIQCPVPAFMSMVDLVEWVDARPVMGQKRSIVDSIFMVVIWVLWTYRNVVVFQRTNYRKQDIFDNIRDYSFVWFSARNNTINMSRVPELIWYLECSFLRHVTCEKCIFEDLVEHEDLGNDVDVNRRIKGYGTVRLKSLVLSNVLLVEGLKLNISLVSKLCDYGYGVFFDQSVRMLTSWYHVKTITVERLDDFYSSIS
ncbi:hypothetical protein LXL04_035734 [Taraxacum kok-saghyz]